jgi:ABC-type bacteriocin/lantibiotic exporter with double-glycine peptidase domain
MLLNKEHGLTPVQRVLRLTGQYKSEIRYILLYAAVAGLINLSLPLGIQAIIGQIAGGSINASWGVLIFFVTVGALLAGILRLMQLSVMEYMQRKIFTDSALEFAIRIPKFNLENLYNEHIPELANRFFDTLTLQKGLPKLLIEGSTAALQIIFSLMLLSFYHGSFVTFSLTLLGILLLFFYWAAPIGIQSSLKESKYKYKLAFWLEEMGRMAATFKLAGDQSFTLRHTDEITVEYLNARAKHWRVLMAKFIGGIVFRVFVLTGFLILGSLLVVQNELNIGQFVAAEILVLFVIESVEKLILLHEIGYDVVTAAEKLGQVIDLPLERESGVRTEEFSAPGQPMEVEMKNLSYQYPDADLPVLKNISLKINAGERVLIAGYNGSGRSTLLQILSVLKRNFKGMLLFNGLPKSNLELRSLRRHIGDVSSQEDVFKGTLRDNITMGNMDVSVPTILRVIDQVGLNQFLQSSPAGIDTDLLPGGKNIPGSVVSKILIARAVVGRPSLLSLEDPLGKLNQRDRIKIAHFLTEPNHSWTLICASDDPLLAALCDRVVVLKEGEVIFDGTYAGVQQTEHFKKVFHSMYISQE